MSRSNQTEIINPCQRWHEWNGEKGNLKYYDKEQEKQIQIDLPFTFIFLDQMATIKGWNDASESGIYSNEVRNVNEDVLNVRAFKGGEIAKGIYSEIKDKAKAAGGKFTANIYVAFNLPTGLTIGSLQLKGAALNSWVDFVKANKANLYKQAVVISGTKDGKKGSVSFKTPVFTLKELKEETNKKALELDVILQEHLTKYLSKNSTQNNVVVSDTPVEVDNQFNDVPGADDAPF